MKRFWTTAAAIPQADGYAIVLDDRPMRLPGGPELRMPFPALAEAVAAEWQAAGAAPGGLLSLDDLPLTRLAGTAQHQVAPDPSATVAALARYAEHDLLCYRATHPEALAIRQHHAWQPWLDWAAAAYGARLMLATSLMPVDQSPDAIAALAAATASYDAYALTALGILVPSYGSLVLGMAVAAGKLNAADAHRVSILDELFQEVSWGEDADAIARRANVARDVEVAGRFLQLTI